MAGQNIKITDSQVKSDQQNIDKKMREGFTQLLKNVEKDVQKLKSSFEGKTGEALIQLYDKCKKEIQTSIDEFIAAYSQVIMKALNAMQQADESAASSVRSAL